jgi:hypothetical protein
MNQVLGKYYPEVEPILRWELLSGKCVHRGDGVGSGAVGITRLGGESDIKSVAGR